MSRAISDANMTFLQHSIFKSLATCTHGHHSDLLREMNKLLEVEVIVEVLLHYLHLLIATGPALVSSSQYRKLQTSS